MAAWTQHSNRIGQLTDRQREVLKLMASGRTNPEIADLLGVSLSGAKWHVSEVISRLGVETREEATEVWREEHSLPRRFSNAFHGLFGFGAIKLGLASVTAAGAGFIGIASIVLVRDFRTGETDETQTTLDALNAGYEANQARLNEIVARVDDLRARVEPPGAIYTRDDATEIGRLLAAEVINENSELHGLTIRGRTFGMADLTHVDDKFFANASFADIGLPGLASEFPAGKNLWIVEFLASGFDTTDGPVDVHVTVMFEDGEVKRLESWIEKPALPPPPEAHPMPPSP